MLRGAVRGPARHHDRQLALPSIRADLGFSTAGLQWVVNAHTLALSGFLLLGGRSADLIGRGEVLAGGLPLFGLALSRCRPRCG